jgi:hypothetical protein
MSDTNTTRARAQRGGRAPTAKRCKALNSVGLQCRAWAITSDGFCSAHRRLSQDHAGESGPTGRFDALLAELELCVERVKAGTISVQEASTLALLAQSIIRVYEASARNL